MATRTPSASPTHHYWGNGFSDAAQFPNVAASPLQSTTLETGDRAYVASGPDMGVWVCTDATLNAALWERLNGAYDRRTYATGRISLPFENPITPALWRNNLLASGGDIFPFDDFTNNYDRCFWRLTSAVDNASSPTLDFDGLVFSSIGDVLTFVNANFPLPSNQYIFFEVYDFLDGEAPTIGKVYGQNRCYRKLMKEESFTRYWGPSNAAIQSIRWNDGPQLLDELWGFCFGTTLSAEIGVVPSAWTNNELGLFWLHRNGRKIYDLPNPSVLRMRGEPQGRRSISGASVISLGSGEYFAYPFAQNEFGYHSDTVGGGAPAASGPFGRAESYAQLRERPLTLQQSTVVGIPVWNPISQERALYIKPVGADIFWLQPWDTTRFRLEVVGVGRRNFFTRVQTLTPGQINWAQKCAGPFQLFDFGDVWQGNAQDVRNASNHSSRPGSVRFQLRDLVTNRVSHLSAGEVATVVDRRLRPFSAEVRNQQLT